jgi:hypothetical protein
MGPPRNLDQEAAAYRQALQVQAKLASDYNDAVQELKGNVKLGITPVAPAYKSEAEKQNDFTQQVSILRENLNTVMDPNEASTLLQNYLKDNLNLILFVNRYWGDISKLLGNRKFNDAVYVENFLRKYVEKISTTDDVRQPLPVETPLELPARDDFSLPPRPAVHDLRTPAELVIIGNEPAIKKKENIDSYNDLFSKYEIADTEDEKHQILENGIRKYPLAAKIILKEYTHYTGLEIKDIPLDDLWMIYQHAIFYTESKPKGVKMVDFAHDPEMFNTSTAYSAIFPAPKKGPPVSAKKPNQIWETFGDNNIPPAYQPGVLSTATTRSDPFQRQTGNYAPGVSSTPGRTRRLPQPEEISKEISSERNNPYTTPYKTRNYLQLGTPLKGDFENSLTAYLKMSDEEFSKVVKQIRIPEQILDNLQAAATAKANEDLSGASVPYVEQYTADNKEFIAKLKKVKPQIQVRNLTEYHSYLSEAIKNKLEVSQTPATPSKSGVKINRTPFKLHTRSKEESTVSSIPSIKSRKSISTITTAPEKKEESRGTRSALGSNNARLVALDAKLPGRFSEDMRLNEAPSGFGWRTRLEEQCKEDYEKYGVPWIESVMEHSDKVMDKITDIPKTGLEEKQVENLENWKTYFNALWLYADRHRVHVTLGEESGGYGLLELRRRRNSRIVGRKFVGRGIEPQVQQKYKQFGKYLIHIPSLEKQVLNLKFPSFANIPTIPQRLISKDLANLITDLLDNSKLNQTLFTKLDKQDQHLFTLLCHRASIDKVLGLVNEQTDDDEEMKRFELVRGEIMAGNNNPDLLKEMKLLTMKFVSNGRITKSVGHDLLYEISALV